MGDGRNKTLGTSFVYTLHFLNFRDQISHFVSLESKVLLKPVLEGLSNIECYISSH